MSDPCSLTLVLRKQDLPIWDEVFASKVVIPSPDTKFTFLNYVGYDGPTRHGILVIEQYEIPDGWRVEFGDAATAGAVFLAYTGPGDEYPAYVNVAPGNGKLDFWELRDNAPLLCANPRTGRVSAKVLLRFRRFQKARRTTVRALKKLGWNPRNDT